MQTLFQRIRTSYWSRRFYPPYHRWHPGTWGSLPKAKRESKPSSLQNPNSSNPSAASVKTSATPLHGAPMASQTFRINSKPLLCHCPWPCLSLCSLHSSSPRLRSPHFCNPSLLGLDYTELTPVSAPLGLSPMEWEPSQGLVTRVRWQSQKLGLIWPLTHEAAPPPPQYLISTFYLLSLQGSSCNYVFTRLFTCLLFRTLDLEGRQRPCHIHSS